jgi:uncharacterized protein GlcG (DUF336 family)
MPEILPPRAFAPMLVFVSALGLSFAPPGWPATAKQSPDAFSLADAERVVAAAAALASRDGSHAAFVVLSADGEPVVAAEVPGTSAEARTTAMGRANCLASMLHSHSRTSHDEDHGKRCEGRGADVVRRGPKVLAVVAVAGAGEVKDEQILGAAQP